jgi:hypothetical protein
MSARHRKAKERARMLERAGQRLSELQRAYSIVLADLADGLPPWSETLVIIRQNHARIAKWLCEADAEIVKARKELERL